MRKWAGSLSRRRCRALLLAPVWLALYVTGAAHAQALSSLIQDPGRPARTSFAEFKDAIRSAEPPALARTLGAPQADVGDAKRYILQLYDKARVASSFEAIGGAYDCLQVETQPGAVALLGAGGSIETPPKEFRKSPPIMAVPRCPDGFIPMRRLQLAEIVQSGGLRRFLSKYRSGLSHAHFYAHALEAVTATGASSELGLWSPRLRSASMSLSQLWVAGGSRPHQTVEAGWQVATWWRVSSAVPFVFWTANGYADRTCYNLECPGFVQTSSAVILGLPWAADQYSVEGRQVFVRYEWRRARDTGSWWLAINGTPIGYYPSRLFGAGRLSNSATTIDFGGEMAGDRPSAEMGSGAFPTEGAGVAASHRSIRFIDLSGSDHPARLRVQRPTRPACYAIAKTPVADGEGDAFLYGGPGTEATACR